MSDLDGFFMQNDYSFRKALEIFPEITKLNRVPQNPKWHAEGDVFVHTKMVCKQLIALDGWTDLTVAEKGTLFLAAIFHDIGKSVCTKEMDGEIISPKHSIVGEKIFRQLFYVNYGEKYHLSFAQREEVASLIRFHGLPPLFLDKDNFEKYVISARERVDFRLLYLLAKADSMGRISLEKNDFSNGVEIFKDYAINEKIFDGKYRFKNQFTKRKFFSSENIWAGSELYNTNKFTVYMMSGLPFAGKDFFIRENFSEIPMISLDSIREELNISPKKSSAKVVAKAIERAKIYLRDHETFVWNATNITKKIRGGLISLFESYGAAVNVIYLEVPYSEMLRRSKVRQRSIPMGVLENMIRKLEIPSPNEAYTVEYRNGVKGELMEALSNSQ